MICQPIFENGLFRAFSARLSQPSQAERHVNVWCVCMCAQLGYESCLFASGVRFEVVVVLTFPDSHIAPNINVGWWISSIEV